MAVNVVNPDLVRERENATFDCEQMTNVLDGGAEVTKTRRRIENLVLSDSSYKGPDYSFLTREEKYSESVRKGVYIRRRIRELGIVNEEERKIFINTVCPEEIHCFGLHDMAFLPAIRLLATHDQMNKWQPLIDNLQMHGNYCQTELGHGSNVRGIQTTATFDAKTDEFVLNTPCLEATKWWVGNLGRTSTHSLLYAQLYTQDVHRGVQAFLLPLRDVQTNQPLPGITVGDIGPKFGADEIDNGFLQISNVRIPRENMLMKLAQVSEDGSFTSSGQSDKLVYGGMLNLRCLLPAGSLRALSKALTIAIRYSCVRHQSELKPGAPEPQILDYQTQQFKLFPSLAASYAYQFATTYLCDSNKVFQRELAAGNTSKLKEEWTPVEPGDAIDPDMQGPLLPTSQTESATAGVVGLAQEDALKPFLLITPDTHQETCFQMHVLSAGLKAYISVKAVQGIEWCRVSCGGHGYSMASGIPKLYTHQLITVTAEGEYSVLMLQVAGFLMKCYLDAQRGRKLPADFTYLTESQTYDGDMSPKSFTAAHAYRAKKRVGSAFSRLAILRGQGKEDHEARNDSAVYLVQAAEAHCEYIVMKSFADAVHKLQASPAAINKALEKLLQLHSIHTMSKSGSDYLQGGFMSDSQLDDLTSRELSLLSEIRRDAVVYVDAFDFPDATLCSVLGRYDGQVYENLYKWAQKSTLNKTQVHRSFDDYLKSLRKSML